MSIILAQCQQPERLNKSEEKFNLNSSDVTLLHWEKTKEYQLRFKCPICDCVELIELSENYHQIQLAKLRNSDATKQALTPPRYDTPSQNLRAIDYDDVINFHEQAEQIDKLTEIMLNEKNN